MAKDTLALVGQIVSNIRFDAIVDEGGFGYVYRGRHMGLDEPVAIKCLKTVGGNSELGSFESRFRDETKIAYKLSQGSLDIVRSISSGTLTTPNGMTVPYMVLEWLDGRSMTVEMAARRNNELPPFTFEEMMKWMAPPARALAHAHKEGVVHRDVKPGNLFVAETRDGKRVKVLDFGLAKILQPDTFMQPEAQPTAAHVFVCSPSYGAPEQFSRDIGALSPATDVYSFAFVLMEMMTGKKVREVSNIMEGMLRAIDPRFASPTPASLGLELSPAVEKVFAKAVALDPLERWSDAGELWDALEAAAIAPEVPTRTDPLLGNEAQAAAKKKAALDEAKRLADRYQGVSIGKGGTVAMAEPSKVVMDAKSQETTLSMAGAPKLPPKVETDPMHKPVAPRTLPLGTRIPAGAPGAKPLTASQPDPLPPPRAPMPSSPVQEAAPPPAKPSVLPWVLAVVVFLLAAAGTLAIASRHR